MKELVPFSIAAGLFIFACGGVDPSGIGGAGDGNDSAASDDGGSADGSSGRRLRDGGSTSSDSGVTTSGCGDIGQNCCNDDTCNAGDLCTATGCVACGDVNQPCCLSPGGVLSCNDGSSCLSSSNNEGTCIASDDDSDSGQCGTVMNACCAGGVCTDGSFCFAGFCG